MRDVFPGLLDGELDTERFGLEEKTVSKMLDRFCGTFEGVARWQTGSTSSVNDPRIVNIHVTEFWPLALPLLLAPF